MDSSEFKIWFDYHRKAYPGLVPWLKTNDGQSEHWERILQQVTLPQAKSATDDLVSGDEQPKGYGEHPRWIRRIAMAASGAGIESYEKRQEGPRVKDDRLIADCWRCMDFGVISVLSPACLKRLWKDDRSKGLSTCILACVCKLGRSRASSHRIPQYQSGHALFGIEEIIENAIAEIRDHATLTDAKWAIARRMLLEFEGARHVHPDFMEYAGTGYEELR